MLLLDVTPLSLGIETVGGMCTRVIERNTSIPISKSQIFTTAASFQPSVEIHVLQGERPKANQNKTLGKFKLKGIQKAMRGVPQIEVTFTIDVNGIVNVSAKDLSTGKQQEISITASSNMSDADIQKAIRDAEEYADTDEKFRGEIDARNKLEQLINQAQTIQKKLSKEDKGKLNEPLKNAKKASRSKSTQDIESACDQLEQAIAPFLE